MTLGDNPMVFKKVSIDRPMTNTPRVFQSLGGTPQWNMSRMFQGIPRCASVSHVGTTLEQ